MMFESQYLNTPCTDSSTVLVYPYYKYYKVDIYMMW